jgi:hypothetical protein
MYIIRLAGSIKTQKYWAVWIFINEIPIEVRKIKGVTKVLLRKYLIKWYGISSSTNLRLYEA